jgi:hypothetical protein
MPELGPKGKTGQKRGLERNIISAACRNSLLIKTDHTIDQSLENKLHVSACPPNRNQTLDQCNKK